MSASTEKDAVNIMLRAIREAPVNSLSGALPTEVSMARNELLDTSKEVQQKGWVFNREKNYSMTPNNSDEISIPDNILQIHIPDASCEYIQRGTRLYNRTDHTYTITDTLKADIVLYLNFDELPEAARRYILVKAARRLQAYTIGSQEIAGFTQVDELDAYKELLRFELRTGQYNTVRNNPHIRRSYRRRPY